MLQCRASPTDWDRTVRQSVLIETLLERVLIFSKFDSLRQLHLTGVDAAAASTLGRVGQLPLLRRLILDHTHLGCASQLFLQQFRE